MAQQNTNTLLDMAVGLLQTSRAAVQAHHLDQGRDSLMQCIALLEASCVGDPNNRSVIQACHQLVQEIAEHVSEFNAQTNSLSIQSMVSDDDTHEDNRQEGPNMDELTNHAVLSDGFGGVLGCEDAKTALFENIILPLRFSTSASHQSIFQGIRAGTGNVLLHGPPGTGKTLLAQATAVEAGAAFYSVHPSDVLSKYQGDSERYLKEVFRRARQASQRAIVFFDEFDSIATSRGSCGAGSSGSSGSSGGAGGDDGGGGGLNARRLLSELLVQMTRNKQLQQRRLGSGAQSCAQGGAAVAGERTHPCQSDGNGTVVVLAATNRLLDLDEAVLRRFECKVHVPCPGPAARRLMLQQHLRGVECSLGQRAGEWEEVVAMTAGWSGSDIEILCREAAMAPVREVLSYHTLHFTSTSAGIAQQSPPQQQQQATKRQRSSGSSGSSGACGGAPAEPVQDLVLRPVCLQDFVRAHAKLLQAPDDDAEEGEESQMQA